MGFVSWILVFTVAALEASQNTSPRLNDLLGKTGKTQYSVDGKVIYEDPEDSVSSQESCEISKELDELRIDVDVASHVSYSGTVELSELKKVDSKSNQITLFETPKTNPSRSALCGDWQKARRVYKILKIDRTQSKTITVSIEQKYKCSLTPWRKHSIKTKCTVSK